MKNHYLGKTNSTTLLGVPTSNDHSIFQNPNAELRKQIADFKIDATEVEMGWPSKKWKIIEWEGDEAKCQEGRNTSYFKRSEIEEALKDKLEYARNQAFKACDYFKNAFGVISAMTPARTQLKKIDLQGANDFMGRAVGISRELNPLVVEGYETFYEFNISTYKGVSISATVSAQMLKLHFNADGDYVNRDYNEDLLEYECKDISPMIIFEEFEKSILALGDLEYCKGKYYSDKNCYIPYYGEIRGDLTLGVEIVPIRYDNKSYQHSSGDTIYKKPAVLEKKTSQDLLDTIKSKMPKEFFDLFESKTLQEA